MLAVDDVLDILSIPLIGIVPESKDVLRASNVGAPVSIGNLGSPAAAAYIEAARRLAGEPSPVVSPAERRGLFSRFFARRAA
jgi:septum site-determining protein MinD